MLGSIKYWEPFLYNQETLLKYHLKTIRIHTLCFCGEVLPQYTWDYSQNLLYPQRYKQQFYSVLLEKLGIRKNTGYCRMPLFFSLVCIALPSFSTFLSIQKAQQKLRLSPRFILLFALNALIILIYSQIFIRFVKECIC